MTDVIYRILVLVLLAGCIIRSGGLTRMFLAGLGAVAVIITLMEYIPWTDRKMPRRLQVFRMIWMGVYAIAFIASSIYYNEVHLPDELPMRSVTDQHIYQKEDEADGRLPDAYLRELIRYKKIRVPYEIRPYSYYNPIEDEEERGAGFVADYYIEENYARYFKEYSAGITVDESLPKTDQVAQLMGAGTPEGFSDLGIANDMLRYTFMLNKENSKETRYFWYSWYYYSFADDEDHFPRIYVDKAGCEGSDELVAIWDKGENLYIMGAEDYEKRINLSV